MSTKLWGGRFEGKPETWVDEFGASIGFDQALAVEDITGSIAHVTMLGATGIISPEEAATIKAGLEDLLARVDELEFTVENEDIHMNIESLLHELIGPVAGKLHTARSRNDQVATDMHLWIKNQTLELISEIEKLQKVFIAKAEANVETVFPGTTHLQHAQPVSFAHQLLAYTNMFERDRERFEFSLKHADISPLGAAALAGTTYPIDRHKSAELLGFSSVYANSLDAVSDRDYIIEFLTNCSMLMMHLSRFAEEIILWTTHEYKYVTLSDTYSTGSSIMPQKKNPDMAELIRGKVGRVYGDLICLLTVMKGLPLAYNKDFQEDKEGMFDAYETTAASVKVMAGMVETMTVNADVMKNACVSDFSNATELADYLAARGIPFREAHAIVGKLVLDGVKTGRNLQDIPLDEYKAISPLIEDDIYHVLDPYTAVERRNSYGGTGFSQVREQLAIWNSK